MGSRTCVEAADTGGPRTDESDAGVGHRGRPRRGTRPDVPWREIEEPYVFGEVVGTDEAGREQRRHWTIRELSNRFGLTPSLVGYRAKRGNWLEQRNKLGGQVQADVRCMLAGQAALQISDMVDVLDRYIRGFIDALEAGRLATPTIADIATAVKLKQGLVETLAPKDVVGGGLPSLGTLQKLYSEARARDRHSADERGVVLSDSPPDELKVLRKSPNSGDDDRNGNPRR